MDTLEQQLTRVFGEVRKTNSNEYIANCPKCIHRVNKLDTKFHLYIHPNKYNAALKKKGTWFCHRCHWKGWGLDTLGIATIEEGSKLKEVKSFMDKFRISPLTESLKFPDYFTNDFSNLNSSKPYLDYLLGRGVRMDQIVYYKLGYCTAGKYKNCVILPVFEGSSLRYFVGRDINKKRYMNPPMPNRGVLFNYTQQNSIILTEGIFDAIAVGYKGVALLGKYLKDGQKALLMKGLPKTTYVMLDSDAKKEAVALAKTLASVLPCVRLVSTFDKKDPGNMTEQEVAYALEHSYSLSNKDILTYLYGEETQAHQAPCSEDRS